MYFGSILVLSLLAGSAISLVVLSYLALRDMIEVIGMGPIERKSRARQKSRAR